MNCSKGDLAIIVRPSAPTREHAVGMIVRCLRFHPAVYATFSNRIVENVWQVELADGRRVGGNGYPIGVPDVCLRPIRHPGPDEVDQIVELVGAAPKLEDVRRRAAREGARG